MNTETKNWDIRVDTQGLTVSGVVTVPTPAYKVALVRDTEQPSSDLKLNLIVEREDAVATIQVITDKDVTFFEPGEMKYNSVYVYHKGEMLIGVTDYLMGSRP